MCKRIKLLTRALHFLRFRTTAYMLGTSNVRLCICTEAVCRRPSRRTLLINVLCADGPNPSSTRSCDPSCNLMCMSIAPFSGLHAVAGSSEEVHICDIRDTGWSSCLNVSRYTRACCFHPMIPHWLATWCVCQPRLRR